MVPRRHPQHVSFNEKLWFATRRGDPRLSIDDRMEPRPALRIRSDTPAPTRFRANDQGTMEMDDVDTRFSRGSWKRKRHGEDQHVSDSRHSPERDRAIASVELKGAARHCRR